MTDNERGLDEICEDIVDDGGYSDEVEYIAEGLLQSVRRGDLDA